MVLFSMLFSLSFISLQSIWVVCWENLSALKWNWITDIKKRDLWFCVYNVNVNGEMRAIFSLSSDMFVIYVPVDGSFKSRNYFSFFVHFSWMTKKNPRVCNLLHHKTCLFCVVEEMPFKLVVMHSPFAVDCVCWGWTGCN